MSDNALVSEEQVLGYLTTMSNWGRWGEDDQLGALNLITPEKVVSAAALVREGVQVSLSRVIEFSPKPDPHEAWIPPIHFMANSGESAEAGQSGATHDWAGLPLHGHYVTHLDAHSHLLFDRKTYNGISAEQIVTNRGALAGGVDNASRGIVSRGVLLDIAALRGVDWIEGNDAITAEELAEAEERGSLRVEAGDVVLVRTGYGRRRVGHRLRADEGLPGLGADCLTWIRDREPAVIGTDTGTDPYPSGFAKRLAAPVHTVAIVAMGMWVADNLELEGLATQCEASGRSEFFFTASPLRLKNSTGSPFNPIAVF